jgi:hypothetical protein
MKREKNNVGIRNFWKRLKSWKESSTGGLSERFERRRLSSNSTRRETLLLFHAYGSPRWIERSHIMTA